MVCVEMLWYTFTDIIMFTKDRNPFEGMSYLQLNNNNIL